MVPVLGSRATDDSDKFNLIAPVWSFFEQFIEQPPGNQPVSIESLDRGVYDCVRGCRLTRKSITQQGIVGSVAQKSP
jgi:hypothetical protein